VKRWLRAGLVLALTATVVVTPAGAASAATHKAGAGWALDRLDQVLRQPDDNRFRWDDALSGSGVTIHVLSDGTSEIPQLAGRVEPTLAFGNGRNGSSTVDSCWRPSISDGTALAALAAGDVHGVARDASVKGLQIPSCWTTQEWVCTRVWDPATQEWVEDCRWETRYHETLDLDDYIDAIRFVTDHGARPAVGLLDRAWPGGSPALEQALRDSVAAGVTWVVPAGDGGTTACDYTPSWLGGGLNGLITVGSIDINDGFVSGTNGGNCLDLFAPGKDVDSPSTSLYGGTSVAAAYTAGVVAQLREAAPASATPADLELTSLKTNATSGRISGLPTGSPNLLLHSAWWGPVVWLNCENMGATPVSGRGGVACDEGELNGPATSQRWRRNNVAQPAWDDESGILDTCQIGTSNLYRVEVVRNGLTDSTSRSLLCTATP
jgi:hypothetical protein